jgi:hypothetical protein
MPYRGACSSLDRGVELLRRHRVRQKNPHGAVRKAEQRDGKFLASARIARQETFRGFGDAVENAGSLLRRPRAAFFRRFIEEIVAPVREQEHTPGVIGPCEARRDERGFERRFDILGLRKRGAELRTEAFGGGNPGFRQKRALGWIAVVDRAYGGLGLFGDQADGGVPGPELG